MAYFDIGASKGTIPILKTGKFTLENYGTLDLTFDFKVTKLCVLKDYKTVSGRWAGIVYDESLSTTSYTRFGSSSASAELNIGATTPAYYLGITAKTDTTFTLYSNVRTNGDYFYFAIGEEIL